ncbi:Macrolide export ATP-binding/permease protein MacB [Lacunisphaera limnophila]|uniref:Macrolide export ATP-binding/permease protein MacB n=1 Tax=Lacunisphaera limnophila TaxID=1838286 RepID=A0A1D8AZ76_9BACT|nr:ADOP family duplicated permease [Lacunisphaera limnophila]AOS46198.1 Macrolide export ATP-binding/permease protein MacB [Lacunisphaera limnophila]
MKQSIRSLLRSPGHTLVALLTLALGIGVNTAMVSSVQAVLFRPAPFPHPEQIARIIGETPQGRMDMFSHAELQEIRAGTTAFASLTTLGWDYQTFAETGQPTTRLVGVNASAEMFTLFGALPALGRAFTAEENQPGRNHVIVISHTLWHERYGGRPDVLGRVVRLNGEPVEIIGVMPASFEFQPLWDQAQFWRPLSFTPEQQQWRDLRIFTLFGRLLPDSSLAAATAGLAPLAETQARAHPSIYGGFRYRVLSLQESVTDPLVRNISWMLLALSVFVLLIACANLANLQLARTTARARDLAIRAALGATRGTLIGHQLRECLVLALAGGALGLLVATGLNRVIARRLLGGTTDISLDLTTLGITCAVALFTGILFGIFPAWLAARTDVNAVLKQQARGSSAGRGQARARNLLIVAEVALALVLLGGAGVMHRGLARLLERPAGWDTGRILTGILPVPDARINNDPQRAAFFLQLESRLAALPGVEQAAIATSLPINGYNADRQVLRADQTPGSAAQLPAASHVMVTPGFFATLGIPLLEGRLFPADTRANGPRVVVINAALARALWPGQSAIGQRLGSMDSGTAYWAEVIGVVRDVDAVARLQPAATPFVVYKPLVHEPWGWVYLVVRSERPELQVDPLQRAVVALDPEMPSYGIWTVPQAVREVQHNVRLSAELLSAFALLGLALAAVGIYGVTANLVAQRTGEFGIRLALGARPSDLLRLVLWHGLTLAATGLLLGAAGALALARYLGSLMPRVAGLDFPALAGVAGLLLAVTLVACYLPARRATQVDPLEALRTE